MRDFDHRSATLRACALLQVLLASFALTACAHILPRAPVPSALVEHAQIPGVPDARSWGDAWPEVFFRPFDIDEAELRDRFPAAYGQPHSYLAISGGGANGAFGAGVLLGWTAAGTRPKFTMVTGASTGALTAPFAFLGPEYDDVLRTVYTTMSTKDVVKKKGFLAALRGDSLSDTGPLRALIARYVTPDVVAAIAREYETGRRLWVGTVNLDTGRPVLWNIGAIAASNYPQKVELVRHVLLASSAIPVVYPPALIPVEADGRRYDEMHVDGGAASQVWFYPAAFDWRIIVSKLAVVGRPQVYVIRNGSLAAAFAGVDRRVVPIATRAISSLIRAEGVGDLYRIYALCQRDGNDFNLTYIPTDFTDEPTQPFDPVYMHALFDRGYRMAVSGNLWQHEPPGLTPGERTPAAAGALGSARE